MKPRLNVISLGGICLAGGALAFFAVFSYLAAKVNCADVLCCPSS